MALDQENRQESMKKWAKIVAKAWADEDFKAQLMADPASKLREEGVDLPEGIQLNLVENTDKKINLVLPARPQAGDGVVEAGSRLAAIPPTDGPDCW